MNSLRLENINSLLIIAIILVLTYFFYAKIQKNRAEKLKKLGHQHLFRSLLVLPRTQSFSTSWWKMAAIISSLGLAIANPQCGSKSQEVTMNAVDVFVAIDISKSMDVQDLAPSRLEKTKKFAEELLFQLKGNRVGLIIFAGNAYIQMPLTHDVLAAVNFVRSISTDMAGTQGTALASAINLASRNLSRKKPRSRALIIISDGEDHEEDVIDQAREAVSQGLSIFAIVAGTEKGGFIPMQRSGVEGYKMDEAGEPVISKVNVPMMQELASVGNGKAYMLNDNTKILKDIEEQLQKVQTQTQKVTTFAEANSYYWLFAILALGLILTQFYGLKTNFWRRF